MEALFSAVEEIDKGVVDGARDWLTARGFSYQVIRHIQFFSESFKLIDRKIIELMTIKFAPFNIIVFNHLLTTALKIKHKLSIKIAIHQQRDKAHVF